MDNLIEVYDTVVLAHDVVNAITCVCDTIEDMDREAARRTDIADLLKPIQRLGDYAMRLLDKALEAADEEKSNLERG